MPEFTTNPIQQKAIEFAAGTMQVLAGPGSGKTFVITQRIRYLIEHYHVEPSSILVITFTKAAATEMQQRFDKLMEKTSSPVQFGTFHAIFYHILKQTSAYRKFTLITEMEKRKIILRILHLPASQLLAGSEKVEYLLRTIGRIKNNGEIFDECSTDLFTKVEVQDIYRQYNDFLSEFQKMDFDDMGLLCLKLFQENPDILSAWQQKFQYIMIDEFQDISPMQYQIIRFLAASENLFVVGDDDQSIYGFRGAKPDIMHRFMTDYPNAEQLLLDVNYRCHEQIVEKSMQMIALNQNRFTKKIRASHCDGEGVLFQPFSGQEEENEWLLQELKKLTARTEAEQLCHTAVIYRTNYECSLLAEKLLLNEIPFVMKETLRSRFEHFVIQDILAYLEFANGNRSREIFHLFMNRPLRYLKKDCAKNNPIRIEELLSYYQNDKTMQETVRKLFHDIERIGKMRPQLAINYIRKVVGYDLYLKENGGGEGSEKLLQIADDFQTFAGKFQNFRDMNDYISQSKKLIESKKKEAENEEQRKTGISLMTMHASKGLEFDTVYLPDVNEGKIPIKQSVTTEAIEEERRMLYVAMTRAKKTLYILFCDKKEGKEKPSRFLTPILNNGCHAPRDILMLKIER
ncbi:MAG: ATP-dependent helicase [Lachnospiraceae bacterium]|nr:ATP-dependent helicase [Lachnospiraceae bacterium]